MRLRSRPGICSGWRGQILREQQERRRKHIASDSRRGSYETNMDVLRNRADVLNRMQEDRLSLQGTLFVSGRIDGEHGGHLIENSGANCEPDGTGRRLGNRRPGTCVALEPPAGSNTRRTESPDRKRSAEGRSNSSGSSPLTRKRLTRRAYTKTRRKWTLPARSSRPRPSLAVQQGGTGARGSGTGPDGRRNCSRSRSTRDGTPLLAKTGAVAVQVAEQYKTKEKAAAASVDASRASVDASRRQVLAS